MCVITNQTERPCIILHPIRLLDQQHHTLSNNLYNQIVRLAPLLQCRVDKSVTRGGIVEFADNYCSCDL